MNDARPAAPSFVAGPWWTHAAWEFRRGGAWLRRSRLATAALAAIAFLTVALVVGRESGQSFDVRRANVGVVFLLNCFVAFLYVGILFAPIRATALVCKDQNRDITALVLASPTSAFAFLLGKALRVVRNAAELMLAAVPMLALSVAVGAGRADAAVFACVVALSFACVGAAAGVLAGALVPRFEYALTLALIFAIAPFFLAEAVGMGTLAGIAGVTRHVVMWERLSGALLMVATSAAYVSLASLVLGRGWKARQRQEGESPKPREPAEVPAAALKRNRPPVSDRPLLWRERWCGWKRGERALNLAMMLGLFAFAAGQAFVSGGKPSLTLAVLIGLAASVGGATFYLEERGRMIEYLRASPLTRRDLFLAKFAIAGTMAGIGLASLAIVLAIGVSRARFAAAAAALGFLSGFAGTLVATVAGLRYGMRTPAAMTGSAVGTIVSFTWLGLPWLARLLAPSPLQTALLASSPAIGMELLLFPGRAAGIEASVIGWSLFYLAASAWLARGAMTEDPILPEPRMTFRPAPASPVATS
ncbi:MAG TPA: hypothetical protein VNC50_09775 [Planctomycetia bacterium]|nr:hypothetical protein [Planctomycetia bacterium]